MIRLLIGLSVTAALSACASVTETVDPSRFTKSEIDDVTANHFDTSRMAVARALQPSFDKFGAPNAYVEGLMSAVADSDRHRLYGTGDTKRRLKPEVGMFWEIDGKGLAGQLDPIRTVHLLYEDLDGSVPFLARDMSTRRGKVFTVFERVVDGAVIVSLYPSDKLPSEAEFETLKFEVR